MMITPKEMADGVPIFESKAWLERAAAIAARVGGPTRRRTHYAKPVIEYKRAESRGFWDRIGIKWPSKLSVDTSPAKG